MKAFEGMVNRFLSRFGYEIRPVADLSIAENNFANLVQAYEQYSIEAGDKITPNPLRVKLLARLQGTPPSEAYFIIKALAECACLRGDVCEFGVAQGATSALIGSELLAYSDKTLHLFDSFAGLSTPSVEDSLKDDILALGSIDSYAGIMSFSEHLVRARLQEIAFPPERCVIHRGFIEKIVENDDKLPHFVCFAYVDFDFYEPIKTTLKFLHDRMSVGATIIIDDYDFFSTGAKTAVDEFLSLMNKSRLVYECQIPNCRYGHFAVLKKISESATHR